MSMMVQTPHPPSRGHKMIGNTILLLTVAAAVWVSGCTKKQQIVIWNNTGSPIIVTVSGQRTQIRPSKSESIRMLWDAEKIAVETSGVSHEYVFHHPGRG